MKIIIAPTKKQSSQSDLKAVSKPEFISQSESLRSVMSSMSKNELQASLKTSDKLTEEVYRYYKDTENTVPAAALYTGAVFSAADFLSYSKENLNYAQDKLIILSALYGPLRLLDQVRPYRLDFFTKLDRNLYKFWEETMIDYNKKLQGPIINLASKEFSRMIPKDLLIDIIFLESNGKTQSTNAKIARGTMVKYIIENKINKIDDLKKFNLRDYQYKKDQSSNKELVFAR